MKRRSLLAHEPRTLALWAVCTLGAAAVACKAGPLEVQGETERVVGETVTLELLKGEKKFSGRVTLTADTKGRQKFGNSELRVTGTDEETVQFIIPSGIVAGPAKVLVEQDGGKENYEVPLNISRLSALLTATGAIQFLPLPPSTLAASAASAGSARGTLSFSPDGGLLVSLSGDDVRFFAADRSPQQVAALRLDNVTAIAAIPSGALVATAGGVDLLTFKVGVGVAQTARLPITGTKAIGVSANGASAVILAGCDTGGDTAPDADCVIPLDLTQRPPSQGSATTLDTDPSATLIAVGATGERVVVPDGAHLYGVSFADNPPTVSELSLPNANATPSGVAATTARIDDTARDLFVVADSATRQIMTVAFNKVSSEGSSKQIEQLQRPQQAPLTLSQAPSNLAFGRESQLYVIAGSQMLRVDVSREALTPTAVGSQLTDAVASMAVQR